MRDQDNVRSSGQSIIETVVGITFLIPIVLFLLDIGVLVLANTTNDNMAKTIARAAASARDSSSSEGSGPAAYSAALAAANKFSESAIITKPAAGSFVTGYCWNGLGNEDKQGSSWPNTIPTPNIGDVGIVTSMTVHLPVPFPFLPSTVDFQAKAVEPVVSIIAGADLAAGGGGSNGSGPPPGAGIAGGGRIGGPPGSNPGGSLGGGPVGTPGLGGGPVGTPALGGGPAGLGVGGGPAGSTLPPPGGGGAGGGTSPGGGVGTQY